MPRRCWRPSGWWSLPNILWNLRHGFATLSHTLDNVGWVREATPLTGLNPGRDGRVLPVPVRRVRPGPVRRTDLGYDPARVDRRGCWSSRFRRLCWSLARRCWRGPMRTGRRRPILPGRLLPSSTLIARPRLLMLSLVLNGVICLVLPVLTLVPQAALWRRRTAAGPLCRPGGPQPADPGGGRRAGRDPRRCRPARCAGGSLLHRRGDGSRDLCATPGGAAR